MEKDQIFFLKDRGIIFVNGKDSKGFLQNIVQQKYNFRKNPYILSESRKFRRKFY